MTHTAVASSPSTSARVRLKDDPVRTVGCQLHKVVRTEAHLAALRDGVERVHRATVLATELLNLHLRRCLEHNDPVPNVFNGNVMSCNQITLSCKTVQAD